MKKTTNGFTIIEVVLVLAIAGLIFLMVFLALPALQRSQRDTARRSDAGRLMSQVSAFQANSKGVVPVADSTGFPAFVTAYMNVGGDTFADPEGSAYTYVYGAGAAPAAGSLRYAAPGRCGTAGAITNTGATARQVAVAIGLEGGGAYCQQN